MIEIRPNEERGHNKLSWLDSRFTFSFDQYFDPEEEPKLSESKPEG